MLAVVNTRAKYKQVSTPGYLQGKKKRTIRKKRKTQKKELGKKERNYFMSDRGISRAEPIETTPTTYQVSVSV